MMQENKEQKNNIVLYVCSLITLLFFSCVLVLMNIREYLKVSQSNTTVILVPGFGGSKMYYSCRVNYTSRECVQWPIKPNFSTVVYGMSGYLIKSLQLHYSNSIYHGYKYNYSQSHIKLGNYSVHQICYIDSDTKYEPIFKKFIDMLIRSGYKNKVNMFGLPYDFRFYPNESIVKSMNHFINVTETGDKINIVTHSYGCIQVLHAMSVINIKLVKKHINKVIFVSCPLGGAPNAKIFSKIDLKQAYHQMNLSEKSRYLTTFTTPINLFYYKRVPFGLASAPAAFQRIMNSILDGIPGIECILDDILIHANSTRRHDEILKDVLQRIKKYNIVLITDKCLISQTSIKIFGHILSDKGVQANPDKVSCLLKMKPPTTVHENFLIICEPLYSLIRKDSTFNWDSRCQTSFEQIKAAIGKYVIISTFDPYSDTIVQ
ncbi:hypothetical protein A3Q56_00921, partial [Intoshia linei]